MIRLTESQIEEFAIEQFQKLGYDYVYGPDIAPIIDCRDGVHTVSTGMRHSFEDVVLKDRLRDAAIKINSLIPRPAVDEAIKTMMRIASPEPLANNEEFHRLLTEGVPVSINKNGVERGERVWLVDFDHPEDNDFLVTNQFTIIENGHNKRPDIILFVNGLPLVVFELKNAADENATVRSAYKQIETYKQMIPSLFTYNELLVISDGLDARAGSLSAGFNRYMAWKTEDGKIEASDTVGQLEVLIKGMLNKETLLDLIRSFTVFEKDKTEDIKTGITTIKTVKKVAAYHQYYAVNKAVESTIRATGFNGANFDNIDDSGRDGVHRDGVHTVSTVGEPPANFGLKDISGQPVGDHKAGVIWHTQGSGKSLSMVFYTGKIVRQLMNPTIVVITDRNDLDDQLFDTFTASKTTAKTDTSTGRRQGATERTAQSGIRWRDIHDHSEVSTRRRERVRDADRTQQRDCNCR
jgi:type I restriction enzyme R subunit